MFTSYVLNIYIKRDNLIILDILYNKIKKFFIVNLIKYNSNTITIAQYFIKQIIINIVVAVAIRVVLIFAFSFVARLLLKFLSQFINIIKRLFS
jgi:hypothetical protein